MAQDVIRGAAGLRVFGGNAVAEGAAAGRNQVARPYTPQERIQQLIDAGMHRMAEGDPDEALFLAAFAGLDEQPAEIDGEAVEVAQARAAAPPAVRALRQLDYNPPALPGRGDAVALAGPGARGVAAAGARGVARQHGREWTRLAETGGYRAGARGYGAGNPQAEMAGQAMRSIGRLILRELQEIGGYAKMEAECIAAGIDPLGEIRGMANLGGRGPNTPEDIEAMVELVTRDGTVVRADEVAFEAMDGYSTKVALVLTDTETFIIVQEEVARGAPWDSTYVYAFPGGKAARLDMEEARQAINRVARLGEAGAPGARPGGPQRLAAPGGAAPRPAAMPAAPARALPAAARPAPGPQAPAAGRPAPARPAPQARPARQGPARNRPAEPQAPVPAAEPPPRIRREAAPAAQLGPLPMQVMLESGFGRGQHDGQRALAVDTADGGKVFVVAAPGAGPITVARKFVAIHVSPDGDEVSRSGEDDVDATVEWSLAASRGAGMRP